jgi:acetoacetyl-CoA reductase
MGRNFKGLEFLKNTKFLKCDLSNLEQVNEICEVVKNENIDVLVNNAGFGEPVKFEKLTLKQINHEINLNFISPVLLIQAVLSYMRDVSFGRIINISSISAKQGVPFLEIYSAAKSALNSITQSLSKSFLNAGITINSICPGGIETEMACEGRKIISKIMNREILSYENDMVNNIGIGRLILPEEVSRVVMFLIDKKMSYVSGQCFNVCGTLELR